MSGLSQHILFNIISHEHTDYINNHVNTVIQIYTLISPTPYTLAYVYRQAHASKYPVIQLLSVYSPD